MASVARGNDQKTIVDWLLRFWRQRYGPVVLAFIVVHRRSDFDRPITRSPDLKNLSSGQYSALSYPLPVHPTSSPGRWGDVLRQLILRPTPSPPLPLC